MSAFEMQIKTKKENKDVWESVVCSGGKRNGYDGNPYRYETKKEARWSLNQCYPYASYKIARVVEVNEEPNMGSEEYWDQVHKKRKKG